MILTAPNALLRAGVSSFGGCSLLLRMDHMGSLVMHEITVDVPLRWLSAAIATNSFVSINEQLITSTM